MSDVYKLLGARRIPNTFLPLPWLFSGVVDGGAGIGFFKKLGPFEAAKHHRRQESRNMNPKRKHTYCISSASFCVWPRMRTQKNHFGIIKGKKLKVDFV
jgi:hypothetical protein